MPDDFSFPSPESKDRPRVRAVAGLWPIAVALAVVAWWSRPPLDPAPAVLVPVAPRVEPAGPDREPGREREREEERENAREREAERRRLAAIERARASTLALEYDDGDAPGGRRVASGVVINEGGHVLSVRVKPPEGPGRDSIVARDAEGRVHPARWVADDPPTGLTLLGINPGSVRPVRPSARPALLGAAVFLVGNPYGFAQSVSLGHVAGLDRRLDVGPWPIGGLIQLQAPLHPGDNGALVADQEGGWLGLVRCGLAAPGSRDDDDMGFAIPAEDALRVATQLASLGRVERAFLGVHFAPSPTGPGAEVDWVVAGSPAEAAGLRPGDRIVRLDDRPIATAVALTDRLDRIVAGSEVALEYVRGDTQTRLTLRTATRPATPSPPPTPNP